MRVTILCLAVMALTFWASPAALAQANEEFEALLERMRKNDPDRYAEIMRTWDQEQEVEGPMWGEDGRMFYAVKVKGAPWDVVIPVYTGEVIRTDTIRRREAERRMAPFIVFVSLLSIAGGVVNLCAPKFLWQLRQFSADVAGLKVERTSAWDTFRLFCGWMLLIVGTSVVVIGLVMAFG